MVEWCERVHDRHRGMVGQLLEQRMRADPAHDRIDVPRQDQGGVLHGLAPRKLKLLATEQQHVAAEL
jgi:hypothetical protein